MKIDQHLGFEEFVNDKKIGRTVVAYNTMGGKQFFCLVGVFFARCLVHNVVSQQHSTAHARSNKWNLVRHIEQMMELKRTVMPKTCLNTWKYRKKFNQTEYNKLLIRISQNHDLFREDLLIE